MGKGKCLVPRLSPLPGEPGNEARLSVRAQHTWATCPRQSGECWAKLCGVYVTVLLSS